MRPDGQFPQRRLVVELKPGNPRGVYTGTRQLDKYMGVNGDQGQLWLYNQNPNGSFNFWQNLQ